MTIEVRNLTVRLGGRDVLNDVSGEFRSGRITAILGPNAAGKSTLLRTMIGAIAPARGEIILNGTSVHATPPRVLARQLAFVAQRSAMTSALTARQVIELGRFVLSQSQQRIDNALDRMDLCDVAGDPFNWLSAGQQQRVMVARALAQVEPTGVLILDEPTSSMDIRHAQFVGQAVKEHARCGGTVVLTLHDISIASAWADDVWLIKNGRLVGAGAAADILGLDRLREVFGVEFQRLADVDGRRRLVHAI